MDFVELIAFDLDRELSNWDMHCGTELSLQKEDFVLWDMVENFEVEKFAESFAEGTQNWNIPCLSVSVDSPDIRIDFEYFVWDKALAVVIVGEDKMNYSNLLLD